MNKLFDLPFITAPLTVVTIALLILNDHYLKQKFANIITGKLSDFCGLYFFPLLVLAFITIGVRLFQIKNNQQFKPKWTHLIVIIVFTYSIFASLQLSDIAVRYYEGLLRGFRFSPRVTKDPSDLIAFISAIPLYLFYKDLGQD